MGLPQRFVLLFFFDVKSNSDEINYNTKAIVIFLSVIVIGIHNGKDDDNDDRKGNSDDINIVVIRVMSL